MTRRTKKGYNKFLKALRKVLPDLINIKKMVMDFETGLWSAMRSLFPAVELQGCAFHWTQAIWRKVQDLGLAVPNMKHRPTQDFICQVMALTFLPADHIPRMVDALESRAPAGPCLELMSYVRSTCWRATGPRRTGPFTARPYEPTTTWKDTTAESTEMPHPVTYRSMYLYSCCTESPSMCNFKFAWWRRGSWHGISGEHIASCRDVSSLSGINTRGTILWPPTSSQQLRGFMDLPPSPSDPHEQLWGMTCNNTVVMLSFK